MLRRIILVALAALCVTASPALASDGQSGAFAFVDYVSKLWPVVLTTAGLIASGVLLALATRFASVKALSSLSAKVGEHSTSLETHATRLAQLEASASQSPTRQELQGDIAQLSERMRGMETAFNGVEREFEGVGKQLDTANRYLEMVIERGLK